MEENGPVFRNVCVFDVFRAVGIAIRIRIRIASYNATKMRGKALTWRSWIRPHDEQLCCMDLLSWHDGSQWVTSSAHQPDPTEWALLELLPVKPLFTMMLEKQAETSDRVTAIRGVLDMLAGVLHCFSSRFLLRMMRHNDSCCFYSEVAGVAAKVTPFVHNSWGRPTYLQCQITRWWLACFWWEQIMWWMSPAGLICQPWSWSWR